MKFFIGQIQLILDSEYFPFGNTNSFTLFMMIKFFFAVILSMTSTIVYSQNVVFEDGNFKSYIISKGIDLNDDGEIQFSEAENLIELDIKTTFSSLVGIESFPNLRVILIADDDVEMIDISGLASVEILRIEGYSGSLRINASNCTSLLRVEKGGTGFFVEFIDLSNCTSLNSLNFDSDSYVNDLDIRNCSSLIDLNLSFGIFSVKLPNLDGCTALKNIELGGFLNGSKEISNMMSLESFKFSSGDIDSLTLKNNANLKTLSITSASIYEPTIRLDDCPNLDSIFLSVGNLSKLTADNLPKLKSVDIVNSDYDIMAGEISIKNCTQLTSFSCIGGFAVIENLDLSDCVNLTSLDVYIVIDLNLNNCQSLASVSIPGPGITSSNLSGMISLKEVSMDGLSGINLSGCYNLENFSSRGVYDTEQLDFSFCPNLQTVYIDGNESLNSIILKNGAIETLTIETFEYLGNICVDEAQLVEIQNLFPSANVVTTCEFSSVGKPFKLTGYSYYDVNQDNCATSEVKMPFTKYKLSPADNVEFYFFADFEGKYSYNVPEGNYEYLPNVLYGDDLFALSPTMKSVDLPADGAEVVQDFCFSPGIDIDLIDVTLIPLEAAMPGFNTRYLITYKNTGNVVRSGTLTLIFQDDFMDLSAAMPASTNQQEGILTWDFEDLVPYDSRSIEFSMNLNSPMDIPALNGGDYLLFEAMVTPVGNQDVSSFSSDLNQLVVNSFDPNDKTCLDGDVLDQSMIGDFVKYTIRFENTGTANAVNVVVKDSLDAEKFDVRTLEVLHSSHEVETFVENDIVSFMFINIDLPFADDQNDGSVTFKIKTLSDLTLGDELNNKAEIFFDFNFPIITNTASTVISDLTNLEFIRESDFEFNMAPNPATNEVLLTSEEKVSLLELYNVSGLLVQQSTFAESKFTGKINVEGLNPGIYFVKLQGEKGLSIGKLVVNSY